jgi:endonuclease YncB( thermonuclease family)
MQMGYSICHALRLFVFTCVVWFGLNGCLFAEPYIFGRVVGITDGDTLVLLDETNQQYKIRLAGIDAPEKGQPFGNKSKESLSKVAYEQLAIADCPKTDRYGRVVCVVTVGEHEINLRQIEAGMAWHYKKYEHEQTVEQRNDYSMAEIHARSSKLGLWVDSNPIAPWEWRHRNRSAPN